MEFTVLGWPEEGPTLQLDYQQFSYAGKFVMSSTGKAIVRDDDAILAAVAFNEDRTDPDTLWLRYITTRRDYRGEGIGTQLAAFITNRAHERSYDRITIAVNNLFAYHALHKAGFGFTGEQTGIAELVLEHPSDRTRYHAGLDVFRERDLSDEEQAFLDAKADAGIPPIVTSPEAEV
jgi:GNAT superfamily N-acetyltransferase